MCSFQDLLNAAQQVAAGTVMLLGATDTGKTTLAQALYRTLREKGRRVALLDCDVGQSTIGPPATIGLRYHDNKERERKHLFFVGHNSPRGHFLPMVVGTAMLAALARRQGCSTIIVDTTGFVDPQHGGATLKLWKAELLQPSVILALDRAGELSPILRALDGRWRCRILTLPVAREVRLRDRLERIAHRASLWRAYFHAAQQVALKVEHVVLWNPELIMPGRLIGMDNAQGLCLGLGVVQRADDGQLLAFTPLRALERVKRIRPGALLLDPTAGTDSLALQRPT